MNLKRLTRTSLAILGTHRVRTLLSTSAVIVGVASLVLMMGSRDAAEHALRAQIRNMGRNLLVIRPGQHVQVGRHIHRVSTADTLRKRDVEQLRATLTNVSGIAGVAGASRTIQRRRVRQQTNIYGVEPDFFRVQRLLIASGRAFTPQESDARERVVILGAVIAKRLFETDHPIERSVRIGMAPYRVVGVLAPGGTDLGGSIPDETAYVPLNTLDTRISARRALDAILIQTAVPEALEESRTQAAAQLRYLHEIPEGDPDDFSIQSPRALARAQHRMGETFRALTTGIAAVALAIGGIGITAVMLLSVKERAREIGLRRAIGATKNAILIQFLFEAALLATAGGTIGLIIAIPGNALICYLASWPIVWPWNAAFWALVISVGLGITCGVLPAKRAASLEPATAVRAAQ